MPEPIGVLRCADCGSLDPGPRIICVSCGAEALAPHSVPGDGRLLTWTEIRRPPAGVDIDGPYRVAVIALDAGVQVTGRLGGRADFGDRVICTNAGPPPVFERELDG